MSYVIAIDVGIKNLSFVVWDFTTARCVRWENVSLVPSGRYIPANNVQYVKAFVKRYEHYFDNAFALMIERQIRCNMRIIESILQTMFYDRTYIISAKCVKAHYNLSHKNYKANKAAAVEWGNSFVLHNPQVFEAGLADSFNRCKKQDDLADCLLLLMYYLDTYSNQVA